ncbi:hypothetical protein DM02DRAFT_486106, partial [Periconia macrospinosa]
FVAAASAAKFKYFTDQSCQIYNESYLTVTSAELKDLVIQSWPTTTAESYDSNLFLDKKKCPRNTDNNFKWWQVDNPWSSPGGAIAVVYYKETDTYNLCDLLAATLSNGYQGFCK